MSTAAWRAERHTDAPTVPVTDPALLDRALALFKRRFVTTVAELRRREHALTRSERRRAKAARARHRRAKNAARRAAAQVPSSD